MCDLNDFTDLLRFQNLVFQVSFEVNYLKKMERVKTIQKISLT